MGSWYCEPSVKYSFQTGFGFGVFTGRLGCEYAVFGDKPARPFRGLVPLLHSFFGLLVVLRSGLLKRPSTDGTSAPSAASARAENENIEPKVKHRRYQVASFLKPLRFSRHNDFFEILGGAVTYRLLPRLRAVVGETTDCSSLATQ